MWRCFGVIVMLLYSDGDVMWWYCGVMELQVVWWCCGVMLLLRDAWCCFLQYLADVERELQPSITQSLDPLYSKQYCHTATHHITSYIILQHHNTTPQLDQIIITHPYNNHIITTSQHNNLITPHQTLPVLSPVKFLKKCYKTNQK